MEVLEKHSGNYSSGPLLDCADGSLNFSNILFGRGGVHGGIFCQLVYIFVEIHIHEDILYHHATSGIDFNNLFLRFNQLFRCMVCYFFENHKLYTT